MGRIEMVAVLEDLKREVAEDAREAVSHPLVIVGVAEAAEGEVDRLLKVFEGTEV
jgi:hypothetical protein